MPGDAELERICARNLLNTTDEIIYFKDLDSRFIRLSRGWSAIHGREPHELLGQTDFDVFSADHASEAYADEQRIIATATPLINKVECETWPDRADRWVTSSKFPLRADDGAIVGTFGISRGITRLVSAETDALRFAHDLHAAHAALGLVEEQLRTVLNTTSDAIAMYDTALRYQYLNAAAQALHYGMTPQDPIGRTDRELGRDEPFLANWEVELGKVLSGGGACAVEFSVGIEPDVRWFQAHLAPQLSPDGAAPTGVVISTREVTDLRRVQSQLAHQAVHDPLTGLANRVLMMDRLTQALLRMDRLPGRLAVLFIDVDYFKRINDRFGHEAGDEVLRVVAARLTDASRRTDTVSRFGGDEFVMLCDKLRAEEDVRVIVDRVIRAMNQPIPYEGSNLKISTSVGVVVTRDPAAGAENLVRNADAAMYAAKDRGRNNYQFFDQCGARRGQQPEISPRSRR